MLHQVLRAFLSHMNQQRDTGGQIDPGRAHSAVIDQVIEIYERAHIPMVTRSVLLYHIKQLYQKYRYAIILIAKYLSFIYYFMGILGILILSTYCIISKYTNNNNASGT